MPKLLPLPNPTSAPHPILSSQPQPIIHAWSRCQSIATTKHATPRPNCVRASLRFRWLHHNLPPELASFGLELDLHPCQETVFAVFQSCTLFLVLDHDAQSRNVAADSSDLLSLPDVHSNESQNVRFRYQRSFQNSGES